MNRPRGLCLGDGEYRIVDPAPSRHISNTSYDETLHRFKGSGFGSVEAAAAKSYSGISQ